MITLTPSFSEVMNTGDPDFMSRVLMVREKSLVGLQLSKFLLVSWSFVIFSELNTVLFNSLFGQDLRIIFFGRDTGAIDPIRT